MQTPPPSGKRYVCTFIDDFYRFTTIHLLKEKSETFKKFNEFYEITANKFGKKIQCLGQTVLANILTGDSWNTWKTKALKFNARHLTPRSKTTPPSAKTGLWEMTRCMLLDVQLENKFWDETVMTSNNLQNILPWKSIEKTPYEHWYKRKPYYGNLRRFVGSQSYCRYFCGLRCKLKGMQVFYTRKGKSGYLSWRQARWCSQSKHEYNSLINNSTWRLVRLPKEKNLMGWKCLFIIK